ncbi:sensor histidine kinase [Peribacillus saganii]|uniref:histidine kinase n=2 Tax=Peribacillus saganii TaxID=2303992 RepID=A0A372LQZ7_9BACI|nr:sensor histidine kinase [Peribacillus saganii]
MSMKTEKRTTLLRYWTTRYVITFFVGLLFLSALSMWYMQEKEMENRLNLQKYLADETADRVVDENGNIVIGDVLSQILDEREKLLLTNEEPMIYITTVDGEIIFTKPKLYLKTGDSLPKPILNSQEIIQRVTLSDGNRVYVVKSPIESAGHQGGWVFIVQEERALKEVKQDHELLGIMMFGLGILGWAVIYALSFRISKPIQHVARAAVQIREGNYDISLNQDAREQEIYELMSSFKEMTNRLTQLEKLRAQLFAGVTHDLKTPVASISGLVQAVRDEVVTGEESKEFLDITLKEIKRLQTMIEDLLDYNALSAGAFTFKLEKKDLNILVAEISEQWRLTQEEQNFSLKLIHAEEKLVSMVDPYRLQEIIINLLNNARQSLPSKEGSIVIVVYRGEDSHNFIEICDNGKGIPQQEQSFVFEPFYRGEKKKLKVRGLGLGLPFSRLLAKAQNGDISLKQSSDKGTIFSISLPSVTKN